MRIRFRTPFILCLAVGPLAAQSLQVTSPPAGTVVNPGQSVTVTVAVSGSFQNVSAVGQDPIGFSQQVLSGPPYEFTLQIPSTITPGKYTVGAFGVTPTGDGIDSVPVPVAVERPDNPVSIRPEPALVSLYPGQNGYLRVLGLRLR